MIPEPSELSVAQKKMKKPQVLIEEKNESKKASTKDMIFDALQVLSTRKGVSLYAIKKYVTEQYQVDVVKINYIIKKTIKNELEIGTIVQTKGIGVSGSFKLVPKKKIEKPIKKNKPKKIKKPDPSEIKMAAKKTEKITKTKQTKKPAEKAKLNKSGEPKNEDSKINKKKIASKEPPTKKVKEMTKEKQVKSKKSKMATEATPAKKRAAMIKKRRSVGSIIKPPKMRPKATQD